MTRSISLSLFVAGAITLSLAQVAPEKVSPAMPSSGIVQIYGAAGPSDPVGPGDLLDIRVFNQDQLSGQARVSTDGSVDLPFVGRAAVGGHTVSEIQRLLTQRYGQVLKNPVVDVRVLEVNSRHISITGEVPRPGVYAYSGRVTLLDALSMAGGVDPVHAGSRVYLLHAPPVQMHSNASGQSTITVNSVLETIDMSQLWRQPALNRTLQPGDIIQVPQSERIFVTGDVGKEGEIPLRPGLTVTQAISDAGGFLAQADQGKVRILRRAATGTGRTEMLVNVGDIRKNHRKDVELQADDIVFVDGSTARSVGLTVLDFFSGAGRWRIQHQMKLY